MPPKGTRRGPNANATRGRGRTKPKQSQALIPTPISRWPHLTKGKQVREPLDPQPGYAFLSLTIPSLGSRTTEKGWQLLSSRASLYSPQEAANEAAQLVKRDQQEAERYQELKRQEEERHILISRNIGFLTLKFSASAWNKSQIPLAQSWKTGRVITAVPNCDQSAQTEEIQRSNYLSRKPSLSYLPPNELENEPQRLTRSDFAAPILSNDNLEFPGRSTPEAPEFSPLTPTNPFAEQYPLLATDPVPIATRKGPLYSDLEHPYPNYPYDMAGDSSVDTGGVDESIKDVIQNLFVTQQHVASFRPEIQDGLNRKVEDLAVSLKKLDDLVANPSNPIHDIKIAPDIIDYVDDGRNPDIYTRDFVELVQRGNAVLNGKQKAFRNFGKIFAKSLKENFDGMDEEVDLIMEKAGMVEKDGKYVEEQQNGSAGRV